MTVRADGGCHLWTAATGDGTPLLMCHGGPLALRYALDHPDRGSAHAERMATPWFGINHDSYQQIWAELRRTWHEAELMAACQSFGIPVLILDGAADLRPCWAVDLPERGAAALAGRVTPGSGPRSRLRGGRAVGRWLDRRDTSWQPTGAGWLNHGNCLNEPIDDIWAPSPVTIIENKRWLSVLGS